MGIMRWELSPVSSAIGAIWGDQAVRDYHGAAMALLPLSIEAGAEGEVEEATAALEGEMDALMEGALVVRRWSEPTRELY